jgi:microcystin degradation protein MlrC
VLRWLLDHRAQNVAIALLYDPEVVRIAMKAGPGAMLPVRLGGKLGPLSGDPVDIEVEVRSMCANYVHAFPQRTGEPWLFPAGDIVALRHGTIDVIVSAERCQCFSPSIFADLGIDVKAKQALIPKSYQHFYGAFAPIAAEVIYMAAPGAVPPDARQNRYRRLDTSNLYPWNQNPILAHSERVQEYRSAPSGKRLKP